jgi:hypothetical protein
MTSHLKSRVPLPLLTLTLTLVVVFGVVGSAQAAAPVKLVLAGSFGREVNLTQTHAHTGPTLEDTCTVSKEECQPGSPSSLQGAFTFPESVGGAPNGDVYVADQGNKRIQELTAGGEFVLMFGRKVNKKGGDICTAAETAECQAGEEGTAPGQFYAPYSVAVDPVSGDVYVAEEVQAHVGGELVIGQRVQKFTAGGLFVLEIGKEVNETTKGNLCTHVEEEGGAKCKGPALREPKIPYESGGESGSFNFQSNRGDLLAVGGEHDRLYVADEHRIQEFEANGTSAGEIAVPLVQVTAVALNGETSGIDAVYDRGDVVHEFSAAGVETGEITVAPRQQGSQRGIGSLATSSTGYLAVSTEEETNAIRTPVGALYSEGTGNLITEFTVPAGVSLGGISFNGSGGLFAASSSSYEVLAYTSVNVAELVTKPASCVPGVERETSLTFDCALNGEVNPSGVPGTEAWFQLGETPALGSETPKQQVAEGNTLVPVEATVDGIRPNETLFYRLVGRDQNAPAPELLTGETVSVVAPVVAPVIVGQPSASFLKSASAVLFGELNPENAKTDAIFEYAPATGEALSGVCPGAQTIHCPGVATTGISQSSVYGNTGVTLEATGLQPATVYRYRLAAESENTLGSEKRVSFGPEGSFTTGPAPVVTAETMPAGALGATSAIISGNVNPDGQPAVYAFELGVSAGTETQYGIVFSGPVPGLTGAVGESYTLTGLQPGTSYAYRITLKSGYGQATGATVTFTTAGLPSVLVSPPLQTLLAVPNIAFPAAVAPAPGKPATKAVKCAKGKRLARGRCVKPKAKKASAKHSGRSRRAK